MRCCSLTLQLTREHNSSLVEEDKLELAKSLEAKAKARGVKLILPTDVVLADKFAADANTKIASVTDIPNGWMGLDNGPESTKLIQTVPDPTPRMRPAHPHRRRFDVDTCLSGAVGLQDHHLERPHGRVRV